MIYSVWNPGALNYDYFEDNTKAASINAPAPKHLVSRTLGSSVEQASWPLPANVRAVGSGDHAIGRVASRGSGGSSLGDLMPSDPLIKAGLLLGSAYLLWRYVVKAPRRRRA